MKNMKKLAVIILCFLNSNIFSVADLNLEALSCEDFYNSNDPRNKNLTLWCGSSDYTQETKQLNNSSITEETFKQWCPVGRLQSLAAYMGDSVICNTIFPVEPLLTKAQIKVAEIVAQQKAQAAQTAAQQQVLQMKYGMDTGGLPG